MELLETQDPEKKKLIESSERHKKALEKEVTELSKKTEKDAYQCVDHWRFIGVNLCRHPNISGSKKKKKKKSKLKIRRWKQPFATEETEYEDEAPSLISQVGTQILNQATLLLIKLGQRQACRISSVKKKAR